MEDTKTRPEAVLDFWEKAGPEKWYVQDDAFDQAIRDQFGELWEAARTGACEGWPTSPRKALAKIILLDQFPRNMFRDDPRAFVTDEKAKATACHAIDRNWDRKVEEPLRQFFYMPLMHSERLTDQDHCVRLMRERMESGNSLLHARAHREIIRKFNRFPFRNASLGRASSAREVEFIENGGYRTMLAKLEAA